MHESKFVLFTVSPCVIFLVINENNASNGIYSDDVGLFLLLKILVFDKIITNLSGEGDGWGRTGMQDKMKETSGIFGKCLRAFRLL
jgi:hypothetical protein